MAISYKKLWKLLIDKEMTAVELREKTGINAGGGQITPVATNHYTGKYLYNSGIKSCDLEPVIFHQARPNTEQDLEIYKIVKVPGIWFEIDNAGSAVQTYQNTQHLLQRDGESVTTTMRR